MYKLPNHRPFFIENESLKFIKPKYSLLMSKSLK